MKQRLLFLLYFLPLLILAGVPQPANAADTGARWRPLAVFGVAWNQDLSTRIFTDHQGDHYITECRAMLSGDTLSIAFPMNEAYHLAMEFSVRNESYQPHIWWQPVSSEVVENTIKSSELVLEKKSYALGERLKGHVSLSFVSRTVGVRAPGLHEKTRSGQERVYVVHGPFTAIVRPPDFNPYADENLAAYSQEVALYEFGEADAESELSFTAEGVFEQSIICALPGSGQIADPRLEARLAEVRTAFLQEAQSPAGTVLRELTWHREYAGDYLTIWFGKKNKNWTSRGHRLWRPGQ